MMKKATWRLPWTVAAAVAILGGPYSAQALPPVCDERLIFATPSGSPLIDLVGTTNDAYDCTVTRESSPTSPLGTFAMTFGNPNSSDGIQRFEAMALGAAPFAQSSGARMVCSCEPRGTKPTSDPQKSKFNESVSFSCVGHGGSTETGTKSLVYIEGGTGGEGEINKGKAVLRSLTGSTQDGETYIYTCTPKVP